MGSLATTRNAPELTGPAKKREHLGPQLEREQHPGQDSILSSSAIVDTGFGFDIPDSGIDFSRTPAQAEAKEKGSGHCSAKDGVACSCPNCRKTAPEQDLEAGNEDEQELPAAATGTSAEQSPAAVVEQARATPQTATGNGEASAVQQEPATTQAQPSNEAMAPHSNPTATATREESNSVEAPAAEQAPDSHSAPSHAKPAEGEEPSAAQTQSAPTSSGKSAPAPGETNESEAESAATSEQASTGWIVDDTTTALAEGQMKKTEFLEKLQAEICRSIEPVLAVAGQSTENCPYLSYWFNLYQNKDAGHIEKALKKYAPEAANAATAESYITLVTQKALLAAQSWVITGRLTGIPEGVPTTIPGQSQEEQEKVAQAVQGNIVRFKARDGGARPVDDPQRLQTELGHGQPLDGSVRSRMESAFGTSFANVRTHTDPGASGLSDRVNAKAFTVGNHVAFGSGEYKPGTPMGDALIAHELAHVVQQQDAQAANKVDTGTGGYQALEHDADHTASQVIQSLYTSGGSEKKSGSILSGLKSGLRLQRCSRDSTPAPTAAAATAAVTVTANPQAPGTLLTVLPAGVPATAGPNLLPYGEYSEFIGWTTSARSGFIVQEIVNTLNVAACPSAAAPAAPRFTPHYWEAWGVDASGNVTPIVGAVNDMWYRPKRLNTSGDWSMNANVFWTATLDPAANFMARNPASPDAADLLSTATPPGSLGTSLLTRSAHGTWDCTGAHT